MAAAAKMKVMINGTRKYTVNVSGIFDTADEVDTIIINRSDLIGPDRQNAPTYIRIDRITWSVGAGFDYVVLQWDDAADEVIDYYQGQGFMDYLAAGAGKAMSAAPTTATEGDLLLTGSGGAAGDTYSFLIECTLKN